MRGAEEHAIDRNGNAAEPQAIAIRSYKNGTGRRGVLYGDSARIVVRTVVGDGDLIVAIAAHIAMRRSLLVHGEIEEACAVEDIHRMTVLVDMGVGSTVIGVHRVPARSPEFSSIFKELFGRSKRALVARFSCVRIVSETCLATSRYLARDA